MQVFLLVRAPKKPEKRVKVEHDVVIGRGKECNLQVLSSEVSRQHCRLTVNDSLIAVRDLGSGNGTILNGQTIEANVDTPLSPGDVIGIGPLAVALEFESLTTPAPVAQPGVPDVLATAPQESAPQEIPVLNGVDEPADSFVDEMTAEAAAATELETAEPATAAQDELLPDFDTEWGDETVDLPTPDLAAAAPDAAETTESTGALQFDEASDELASETDATVTAEAQQSQKSSGLKSLFGRFRKGKQDDDAAAVPAPASVTEDVSDVQGAEPATLSSPDTLPETGESDAPEEPVVIARENASSEEVDDAEAWTEDEQLDGYDEEEYADEEYADEEVETAEEEAFDPGFADFLNQIDDPPE